MSPKNKSGLRALAASLLLGALAACSADQPPETSDGGTLQLARAGFADLPGWSDDDVAAAVPAMRRSCSRMLRGDDSKPLGPGIRFGTVGDWRASCSAMETVAPGDTAAARAVFEEQFTVWKATDSEPDNDLFTGYYEPELSGARVDTAPYSVPIFPRPDDLILVDLGDFRDSMKGERIAGRIEGFRLKPYDSRAEIEAGSLSGKVQPILYLADPIDAFFLHIQGSGLIRLPDGSRTRVGYDGHNGHIYFPIGRHLISEGLVPKEEMSMQAIRAWLDAHPDQMHAVMNLNPSYIFFRELTGEGPIGAQGVALTAQRSLAVDRTKHALGVPIWVDIDYGSEGGLRRLMVAQDTGGAIRGPIRGDFFWGSGDAAGEKAGAMAAPGRMWLLLPVGVNPNAVPPASAAPAS
ncbi:MltA domain-containing protein [Thalassobaculum sp. OXR-137]|uniref:murein transglycosylase A n=1 Tax=Thalassobaculum sp. OXR-137 TaxID=3100173 RepID=UPI002AC9B203|nr:MltA domain-containing protein [Thalassobaculum sp. OXR-137]WPZ35487.1 MltA domain-containing protein [Thalassobaculum sp. OXR-137]